MEISREILVQCAKNKKKAHYRLYKILYESLMRIGLRYCRNNEEAASVVNDAYLKISKNLKRFLKEEELEAFIPWAKRITINTAIDYYRSQIKNDYLAKAVQIDEVYLSKLVHRNEYENTMNIEQMDAMLSDLSILNRTVFNLFVIDGYSHKEICEQLSISEDSSRQQISFVRKKLKMMAQKFVLE